LALSARGNFFKLFGQTNLVIESKTEAILNARYHSETRARHGRSGIG
jgi:hypothetical protein